VAELDRAGEVLGRRGGVARGEVGGLESVAGERVIRCVEGGVQPASGVGQGGLVVVPLAQGGVEEADLGLDRLSQFQPAHRVSYSCQA
jgi:hypothetical protein